MAASAVAVGPARLLAQVPKAVKRVGFLTLDKAASKAGEQSQREFPLSLQRLGYAVGKDVVIDWRWADGIVANLDPLARDLVAQRVDVIVARTNGPIAAAMRATSTIPIVMLNGNFPVETQLVASLARPGGNVTGTSYISPQTVQKQVQMLKEVAPRTRRAAVLMSPGILRLFQGSLDAAGSQVGIAFQAFIVAKPDDVPGALNDIAASRVDAVLYAGDPVYRPRSDEIIAFLLRQKIVSFSTVPAFAEDGGLIHYAPDVTEFFDRTASFVDRILKGARPADLPVEQPTKFELVVNLKTAGTIGIKIPQSILVRADRTIE